MWKDAVALKARLRRPLTEGYKAFLGERGGCLCEGEDSGESWVPRRDRRGGGRVVVGQLEVGMEVLAGDVKATADGGLVKMSY